MATLSFSDLRMVISKACTARPSEDISDKYGFSLNIEKLENNLKNPKNKCALHVIAFKPILESRIPSFEDIQLISEYTTRKDSDLESIFNGKVEICELMMYHKGNIQGSIDINDSEGNIISDADLYKFCNDPESLNQDIILGIVKNLPVYKIIVMRIYDNESDGYKYKILIRSNYEMMSYHKSVMDQKNNKDQK